MSNAEKRLVIGVTSSEEDYEADAIAAGADRFFHKMDNDGLWDWLENYVGATIVVVEDRERQLASLVDFVELAVETEDGKGVVHGFLDPREALHQIPDIDPDVVITDVEMPGITGIALVSTLRGAPLQE